MAIDITARRVPWVALALSFLSPGAGHCYCGRIAKGLPLYFAWLLVPLGVTIAALLPPSPTSLVALVLLPIAVVVIVYLYAAIDAWRIADEIGSDYALRDYNRASVYLLLIIVQMVYSIGLVAGVRSLVYEAFVIPTNSMSPTILKGDRILVRKLLPRNQVPKRGDLIVYRNPMSMGAIPFVGRVVAVAGDHLEIDGERLFINGNELARDRATEESVRRLGNQATGRVAIERNSGRHYLVAYVDTPEKRRAQADFKATVPERHVFVLGDNRDRSNDSRQIGSIHVAEIVGYVEYIYWPSVSWSRFGVADDRLP